MTMLRKWDFARREYAPHEVPDSWHVSCYEADMDELVDCARCGRRLPFGEAYTSRQVHGSLGFGYAVCPECHEAEMREETEVRR